MKFNSDNELIQFVKENLFSAVIGDILDEMGKYNQFLPPEIKPLRDDMVVVGRAMTVLEADIFGSYKSSNNEVMNQNFGLMLDALDDLKENEVYICTGASPTYALWGELMSMRAKYLGSAGAVVNGYSRDTDGILALDFPTFSYGRYAQDQAPRGMVIDYRVPIVIGNVNVNTGDILFGDMDGVVVIPKELEMEVIERAYEKATKEKIVAKEISNGMPAKASFEKYGVM